MRSLRSEVSVIFVVALAFTALSSVRSEYTWNGSEWVWSETSETKVCIDWIWFLCISSQIFFVKLKCVKFSPILGRGNRSFCQIKTRQKKGRKIYILKERRGNMPRSIDLKAKRDWKAYTLFCFNFVKLTGTKSDVKCYLRMTLWCLQFSKKNNAKIWWISALESKKWSNQKDRDTLLCQIAPYY